MLDEATRSAILRLREQGHGTRQIGHALGVSRGSVKSVLRAGIAEVPAIVRPEKARSLRDDILSLYTSCKGNLVRVHEELVRGGATLSYQALTAFCRKHELGRPPPLPAGRYHFEPGEEMQHDTSPHRIMLAGRMRDVQTASLVLCHSRMIFMQLYPRFTRFECKVFLTDALAYFDGACARCMIDNTHVIVLSGSGRDMTPVPEMAAFAERLGFTIEAHAIGDANRLARVERPFDYIENNFLAGRTFADWDDVATQARAWCDQVNARVRRHLHASPRELFVAEHARMKRLPLHVPEVYALHHRIVDSEGYVSVQRNRYSAPWKLIDKRLEIRASKDRIALFDGPRLVATHKRVIDPLDARVTDPAHRPPRGEGFFKKHPSTEEQRLCERMPEARPFLELLKARKRATPPRLRWLLRMVDDYPAGALAAALSSATRFGMTDLERLERMALRAVADDFFPRPPRNSAPTDTPPHEGDDHDG